ncbi:MAG: Daunorubicin/doxorubicin resistance ATP-binding protein DrrA [Candidatus Heimdallarchaeota archaeon LC_3]|nr:MAG: Daunorubicin/doxorubicin resistance ATP-binding protein DrrA [Candidatus Heimdallarchaeota archaeon LC_3]
MIEAINLVKLFRPNKNKLGILAVDQVSLSIGKGEIFVLLGPNGAGKTTAIRMLAGVLPLTGGEATVCGFDVKNESELVRENVGMLTETPGLYERLSGMKNLEYYGQMYGLTKSQARQKGEELAERFDLKDRLQTATGSYSKGMKQKLAIAKAMIHEPKVLFLDEPTSALDPVASKNVRDMIIELAKSKDQTIFINTHNLDEAERLADRIGIISKGRLITIGRPKELRTGPVNNVRIVLTTLNGNSSAIEELVQSCKGVISVIFTKETNTVEFTTKNEPRTVIPKVVESLVLNKNEVFEVKLLQETLEDIYFREISNN